MMKHSYICVVFICSLAFCGALPSADQAGPSESRISEIARSGSDDSLEVQMSPLGGYAESKISGAFNDIGYLKERLFSAKADLIGEIPDILREIVELCNQVEQVFQEQPIKKVALALLGASEVSVGKCRQGYMLQYHSWLVAHSDKPSLLRYIKHYKNVQANFCASVINSFGANLDIAGLPNLKNSLEQLYEAQPANQVFKLHERESNPELEQILAEKLADRLGVQRLARGETLAQLNLMIRLMFADECRQISAQAKDAMELRKLLIWFAGSGANPNITKNGKGLIASANICNQVLVPEDKGQLENRIYNLYKNVRHSRSPLACLDPVSCKPRK